MSPRWIGRRPRPAGFPRVSGDEPIIETGGSWITAFSPRERG